MHCLQRHRPGCAIHAMVAPPVLLDILFSSKMRLNALIAYPAFGGMLRPQREATGKECAMLAALGKHAFVSDGRCGAN